MPRFFAFALLLVASSARAVCPLNLRLADPLTLTWDNVPGIKSYEVQESFDNFATSRNYFITATSFRINHRASADAKVYYIVTATVSSNTLSYAPSSSSWRKPARRSGS